MSITLYTTAGCDLCEQARIFLLLVDPQLEIQLLDVADDDALMAAYGERIPVVRSGEGEPGEQKELAWPFGLLEARAFLQGG